MNRRGKTGATKKRSWEEVAEEDESEEVGGGPSEAFLALQKELEEKYAIQAENERTEAKQLRAAEEEAKRAAAEAEEKLRNYGGNPRVFLDIETSDISSSRLAKGTPAGRIVIELLTDLVPKTAENFRQLATGEAGVGSSGFPLHFAGNPFHRIVPGFMAQGGDITREDGTGGESIYGTSFPDEGFPLPHNTAGLVSMANSGPDTNSSQFFVLFAPAPWLDGKHTVFGRLVGEESTEALRAVEACGSPEGRGQPARRVQIVSCGQLEAEEKQPDDSDAADDAGESAVSAGGEAAG
ncbi:unnamed protein product, partial [Phaeothamnion confervicola]